MHTLTKEFRFEAAHRLPPPYKGKCGNVHGHSWKVTVSVQGDTLDKNGMVIDYADIKAVCNPIIEQLDHTYLTCNRDMVGEMVAAQGLAVNVFEHNPTSEVLAQWLYEQWEPAFHQLGCRLLSVKVDETCTASCTYERK